MSKSQSTVYALSPDSARGRSDIRTISGFLRSIAPEDREGKQRAAVITGHLLGYMVAYSRPNLALLSKHSSAAAFLRDDPRFPLMFDHVSDEGTGMAGTGARIESVVAFVRTAEELRLILAETPIARGIAVHPEGVSMVDAASAFPHEPEAIRLGVDLGDGPAAAHVWGH